MAVLDAKELAAYIQKKYYDEKHRQISPIKLQKTLYFLFAYWGGTVRKARINKDFVEEDYSMFDEYLFNDEIEAWVYGPVVPAVYKENNIESAYNENLFEGKEKVKEFIDDLLKELFEAGDFTLVEVSHNDNAWKNNFDYDDNYHNRIISKEEIIDEYARK